jgi:hypothetical protein
LGNVLQGPVFTGDGGATHEAGGQRVSVMVVSGGGKGGQVGGSGGGESGRGFVFVA